MPYLHDCGCVTEDGTSPYEMQHEPVICKTVGRRVRTEFSLSKEKRGREQQFQYDEFMKEHLDGSKSHYSTDDWPGRMRLHVAILTHPHRDGDLDSDHREVDRLLLEFTSRVVEEPGVPMDLREVGRSLLDINGEKRRSFWYS